ncbi:hypothetical protein ACIGO9_29930 [Nocardia asteroides]|uniref:hypothetical protein n=1 Tax=Nocardia asteroides TaxID=1824 RepID=UPI0037C9FDC3
MTQFDDDNLPEPAVTTVGESIGAHRSEDAEQNNVEVVVEHVNGTRTVIRLSPRNARSVAYQLNATADGVEKDYPGAERR